MITDMRKTFICVMFFLIIVGCATLQTEGEKPLQIPLDSWDLLDVDELNSRISEAEAAQLDWSHSALGTALAMLEYGLDARYVELYLEGNRGEVADTVVIVLGRDGFKDDSIRGDWHRAVLYRTDSGTWRFHEIRRAFRCYRARSLDSYSRDYCL
jgi:hypothetical protein